MDIFRMRCFVCVAEMQSLSKAARAMCITQPAMTSQMNALEKELDVKLLERGRVTRLTPMGESALKTFRQMIAEYDAMEARLKTISSEAYGTLRVGFHGPPGWADIHLLIRAFHDRFPQYELQVCIRTWNELREMIADDKLDVAFIELKELKDLSGVESQHLFDEELCVAVPTDNRLAMRRTVTLEDIKDENLFLPNPEASPNFLTYSNRTLEKNGLEIKKIGQGNYSDATLTLVGSGLGITIMPRSFKVEADAVRFIDLVEAGSVVEMGLAWRSQTDNPAVADFARFCAEWDWA